MKKDLLNGKWEFIGAEKYLDSAWQPTTDYVEGMTWEFYPQYFSERQSLGNITENTTTEESSNISYAYNFLLGELKVEIFTDNNTSSYADPQVDKYEIIELKESPKHPQQIKISILNEANYPPPYFRYTLQRVV